MAVYNHLTLGTTRVMTFDLSGVAGVGEFAEFSDMFENSAVHDVSAAPFHLELSKIQIGCCATVGFRLLDNSSDGNRVVAFPTSDNSGGYISEVWEFNPPLDLTFNDYTRMTCDTTLAGQVRGTMWYNVRQ